MTRIGIIREGKTPPDHRVPLTPTQAKFINESYQDVEVVCQTSTIRCFNDYQYEEEGIKIVESLDDCDIIFGVKEVEINDLLDDKTYFFFSHTIKEQPYNQGLLQEILTKKIRLIDYEVLTSEDGQRIIAFGRWAGIVGAYNGLYTIGKRYNLYDIRRAHECFNYDDFKSEYKKIKLPPGKIAITGGGRVAKGAIEVLNGVGLRKVIPSDYIEKYYHETVFTQLNNRDYNKHKEGASFNRGEFFTNPENFERDFKKFAHETDLLIAAAYWDPAAPVLFTREEACQNDFRIKMIADITCDIEGSIPSTKKPSTIDDPIYDWDPTQDKICPVFSDEGNISVMAVDNLPCELPRDASEDFGNQLIKNVLPHLLGDDSRRIIADATITKDGQLTEKFSYLSDYADGKK
ncbi:MAG: NAD(P)-dependent oxidoreductase [Cyclobacteriaceae bacterium]